MLNTLLNSKTLVEVEKMMDSHVDKLFQRRSNDYIPINTPMPTDIQNRVQASLVTSYAIGISPDQLPLVADY